MLVKPSEKILHRFSVKYALKYRKAVRWICFSLQKATTEKPCHPHSTNNYLYVPDFNSLSCFLRFLKIRRKLPMCNCVHFYPSNMPHTLKKGI